MTVNEAVIEIRASREARAIAKANCFEADKAKQRADELFDGASLRCHQAINKLMEAITGEVGHVIVFQEGHGSSIQTD